jgi:AraC-like DNA-binding protein
MKLVTRRGQILLESRIISAQDGLFALSKTFTGSDTRALVTHNAFVLAEVEVLEGSLSFLLNTKKVLAPSRFMLAVPPRAALPMVFDRARVRTEGVTGFSTLTIDVPALYASGAAAHLDWASVRRALCEPVLHRLDPDEGVPLAIARARRMLHELIAHPSPARVAAKQVGVCPETLTRGFRRAYAIGPKQYCHRARLFDAVLHLISGAAIVDAALDAGFSDIKRFYTQFKRLLGTTPGVYARIKKRQDGAPNDRL